MEPKAPGRGLAVKAEPIERIDGFEVMEMERSGKWVRLRRIDGARILDAFFPLNGLEQSRPGWVRTKSWFLKAMNDDQRQFFGYPVKAA